MIQLQFSPRGGNHDLLPMMMMTQEHFFSKGTETKEQRLELDGEDNDRDESGSPLFAAVDEDDVFHFEMHESLEDEVFELHTHPTKEEDGDVAKIFSESDHQGAKAGGQIFDSLPMPAQKQRTQRFVGSNNDPVVH